MRWNRDVDAGIRPRACPVRANDPRSPRSARSRLSFPAILMASTLHVALYHPARLPVTRYGGTERVVVWLARGLVELGHRVTVLCSPGSAVPNLQVIPIPDEVTTRIGGADLATYLPAGVDVLHAHVSLQRPPHGVPFLWTFHGNGPVGDLFPAAAVGLSADHARRHGLTRWVHNGLDPAEYRFEPKKHDYDLFLGRLHSIKGWHWAVSGSRRAGRSLVVAGGWRPTVRRDLRFVGRGRRRPQGGPSRRGGVPLDAGAVGRTVRSNHDRGHGQRHAGARHSPRRVAGDRDHRSVAPSATRWRNWWRCRPGSTAARARGDSRTACWTHFTHRIMARAIHRAVSASNGQTRKLSSWCLFL